MQQKQIRKYEQYTETAQNWVSYTNWMWDCFQFSIIDSPTLKIQRNA